MVLAANASPAACQPLPPQIHTIAGGGGCSGAMTSGGPCDDVPATSVPIADARSVAALPGGGFLYVDAANDLVREVSAAGTVTTVAGDSTSTGLPNINDTDGTLAVDSGLDGPVSVTPLPAGGFLITEYNGARVRMVSPGTPATATITTIAGTGAAGYNGLSGQATAIELNYPTDAELTADGQVLIADYGNNLIRVLSAAAPGATLSTIAGGAGLCDDTTTACEGVPASAVELHDPVSVSPIDGGAGGYLIAEADYAGANAIRQVSEISPFGTFTTVAGVPGQIGGYSGDGGPATSALLNSPEQVVSIPGGGFLIADTHNEVVREVSVSGTITTVAGNGTATYAGDAGNATAASLDNPAGVSPYPTIDGDFLIADENNGAIREVTIPSVSTITLNPAPPASTNGWYDGPVTAVVTANENATISCELDPPAAPSVFAAIPPGCPYTGAGASITGDGIHTVYAASQNSAGDDENPISATIKIETGAPTLQCETPPSFPFGTPGATVTATVSDSLSGPASPVASMPADTSAIGTWALTIKGYNVAGVPGYANCTYVVTPLTLHPGPVIHWQFSAARKDTTFGRMVVTHVPAQAAVNVACNGKGCPFKAAADVTGLQCHGKPCVVKSLQQAKNTASKRADRPRTVTLTPLLARVQLEVGALLTVSVTAPNTIGSVWQFTIRRHKGPSVLTSCLAPGSSTPGKGCTAPVP